MKYLYPLLLFLLASSLSAQNHAPIANNDTIYVKHGMDMRVNVLRNDYDPDGDSLQIFFGSLIEDSIFFRPYRYGNFLLKKKRIIYAYLLQDEHGHGDLDSSRAFVHIIIENPQFDSLSINNINARFWSAFYAFDALDNEDPNKYRGFEAPIGSQLSTLEGLGVNIAGRDEQDKVHLASEHYTTSLMSGPTANSYDSAYMLKWFNIWKVYAADIDYHQNHWNDPGYQADTSILSWPGNGDPANGEPQEVAPYIDVNGNNFYDPLNGDYPDILGDQAIFFIKNDNQQGNSYRRRMGIDLKGLAYAFDCPEDSALHNSIFLRYQITNISDTNYHDVYCGIHSLFQIGYDWDNAAGCDTNLHSYFGYNQEPEDLLFNSGDSTWCGYGDNPPAQAVVFLNKSMDHFMALQGERDFIYSRMQSYWNPEVPLTYGGSGMYGYKPVNYMFPGNPADTLSGWTQLTAGLNPTYRSGLGSFGPFDFNAGETVTIDLALPFARHPSGHHLLAVNTLKERIAKIRYYYQNDSLPCGGSFMGSSGNYVNAGTWNVYPNPSGGKLFISTQEEDREFNYKLYDTFGRQLMQGKHKGNITQVDISRLKPAMYILLLRSNNSWKSFKILKK